MNTHPHRLNDLTAQVADAIVGVDTDQPGKVLREHSARGDLELNGSSSKTGPEKLELQGTRGKDKLSDKYLAGLLDSDGCISLQWNPPCRRENWNGVGPERVYAFVRFDQKAPGREFMELIANSLTPPSLSHYWGAIHQDGTGTWVWGTAGTKAVSVLMRLRKYLVIKRALADCTIDMNGKVMDRQEGQQRFDAARSASPMPKHPTRKWVAGYIDGDGSFDVQISELSARPRLRITALATERVGIDLLQKAYGGSIQEHCPSKSLLVTWTLSMDAAKVRSLFESGKGGIAKHIALKTDQVYFLLGCAQLGHFRDGERIRAGLKQLQVQPHRLSGPGADVAKLLKTVRDMPSFGYRSDARERKRQWELANANTTDYEGLLGLDTVAG